MKHDNRTPSRLKVGSFTFVPSVQRTPEGLFEYDGKYAVPGMRRVAREVVEKFAGDIGVNMIEMRP